MASELTAGAASSVCTSRLRTTCVCNELNELQAGGRSFVARHFWLLLKLRERWKLVGESTYSVVEMAVVPKSRLVGLL
jgi:hypothetical protein